MTYPNTIFTFWKLLYIIFHEKLQDISPIIFYIINIHFSLYQDKYINENQTVKCLVIMLSTNLNPAKLIFMFEQLKGFAVVEHAPDPLYGAEKAVMEPQTTKECLEDKYG